MKLTSVILLSISLLSCGDNVSKESSNAAKDNNVQSNAANPNVIKVYVEQSGAISANGNSISLAELDSAFSKLKAKNGTVYYSRGNSAQDPPKESMDVMELVVKHGLPIQLYTDKTFSVVVRPN